MENDEKRIHWREQKKAYRKNRSAFTLMVTKEEAANIKAYAKEKRMNPTAFLHSLVTAYGASGYILPDDGLLRDLILELKRIGNNVNQLARHANETKSITNTEIKKLETLLFEMEDMIKHALSNPQKISR